MTELSGSAALKTTSRFSGDHRTRYARELAERRRLEMIRQCTNFGLVFGWLFLIGGAFAFYCLAWVPDFVSVGAMPVGVLLLFTSVVVPEALDWPRWLWMTLASFQGRLMMTVILTLIYFLMICPAGWVWRLYRGTQPFTRWLEPQPTVNPGWEKLSTDNATALPGSNHRARSTFRIMASVISLFIRRGNWILVPVAVLLIVLGLVLFFVQSSVLAPFIYTLF